MRVRGPCSTYGCGSDSVFEVNKRKNNGFTIFFFATCINRLQNDFVLIDFFM